MQASDLFIECRAAAKSAVSAYPSKGKTCASVLKHAVRLAQKQIKTAYRAVSQEKTGGKRQYSGEWIADNFYLLDDAAESALASLKHLRNITSSSHSGLPKYFLSFSSYIEKSGKCACTDGISAFLSAAEHTPDDRPDYSDLYSFRTLFICSCLCSLGKICAEMTSENRFDIYCGECGRYISMLRTVSVYNFEKSFENSAAEEYLRKDPSGCYGYMTESTKNFYRRQVISLAHKAGVSEADFASDILNRARTSKDERFRHVGAYLCPEPAHAAKSLYFILIAVTVLCAQIPLIFVSPIAVFLIFPLWEASKRIFDKVFAFFVKPSVIPSLKLEKIPDTDGVLTVITSKLDGSDGELFSKLEKIYLSNGTQNTFFGILGDLGDSETAESAKDEAIIENASDRISALNEKYGGGFFLFVRRRTYSPGEGKFTAHERKRGAVCGLCSLLCAKSDGGFIGNSALLPDSAQCRRIRYVLTIDADTNLPPDCVRRLAGYMLHPLNKPYIDEKKGTVKSGYGIMQPSVSADVSSAVRTPFSSAMCRGGGTEPYAFVRFETYQSIFGEGIFCGKGIFDKFAFEECINAPPKAFPNEKILSHDILEGERLRCAHLTDVRLTDGFPKNELSYLKRFHRWVRGDVQNLLFCGGYFKNAGGKTVINNLSALSKYKIFDNVRRSAVPIFSFLSLLCAAFLPPFSASLIFLASLLYIFYPLVSDFAGAVSALGFECAARRFFSKGALNGILTSFLGAVTEIGMLPASAQASLDAFLRSVWRMTVSHRKMLEWVTASESDRTSDGISAYISKNLAGAVCGAFIAVLSPYVVFRLLGYLWFFFPFAAYYSGKPRKIKNERISSAERSQTEEYAKKIHAYFENCVCAEDNFLPPDNISFCPKPNTAHRTSPTNIGLYLASLLASRDFGFIDSETLKRRTERTLSAVDRLEKYNGLLYNWYDTKTLEILRPAVISSVDCGNFTACLIAVKEGLKEYAGECPKLLGLIAKIEKTIDASALEKLYNRDRNLFMIEIYPQDSEKDRRDSCFDMLMSEARILSYTAIGLKKVPPEHFACLSRRLIKKNGRIGAASWTGTAFEYMMPSIFMPDIKGSLGYEALRFSLYMQKKRTAETLYGKIWGVSESCCAETENGDYRYRAFGVPELASKRGMEKELVISPYSSFLYMHIDFHGALENLEKQKKLGAYGKYGFYEAIDFNGAPGGGETVYCNMSHHMGMSLLSCANALFDGIFRQRFMSDRRMNSISELLEEKIPINGEISKK